MCFGMPFLQIIHKKELFTIFMLQIYVLYYIIKVVFIFDIQNIKEQNL